MGDLKRILIVEDSPTVIEMMRIMLKDYNVKIQTAGSEFGMFQSIESFGKLVDLVLMDITLKSENGLDLVEKLRANDRYKDLPVIVVTEHAKTDLILRAKDLNVKSYIKKPIEKQIFIQRLDEAIGIELLSLSNANVVIEPLPEAEVVKAQASDTLEPEADAPIDSDSPVPTPQDTTETES